MRKFVSIALLIIGIVGVALFAFYSSPDESFLQLIDRKLSEIIKSLLSAGG